MNINTSNSSNRAHSFAFAMVLAIAGLVALILSSLSFRKYEGSDEVLLLFVAWVLMVCALTLFYYVIKIRKEVLPFVSFFHAIFIMSYLTTLHIKDVNENIDLIMINFSLLLLDSLILILAFFWSAINLKKAVSNGNRKLIFKFALYTFLTMLAAPLSLLFAVFGSWAITGD